MNLFDKIDNDTIAIIGLVIVSAIYAATGTGENIVNTIVGGMIGYIGGQYSNEKKK